MGKLTTAASYLAAPKLTYALRNPKKTALFKAAGWAANRFTPSRTRVSAGAVAAKGIGAAAIAVPLGWWLGKRLLKRNARTSEKGNE